MTLGFTRMLLLSVLLVFTHGASADDKKDGAEAKLPPANLENGKELYKKCALCHGQYAQGTLGGLYPRLAGLPIHYLNSQMEKYIDGSRSDDFSLPMLVVGGMKDLSPTQMNDLSSYIASIDLSKNYKLSIPTPMKTDPKKGKELFNDDCKDCHGKWANGREKKKSPPLSGQYPEYMLRETEFFMAKSRHHDNDPDDETFVDYSQQDLRDIFAYVTTLEFKPEKGYFKAPEAPAKPAAPAQPTMASSESSGNTDDIKMETVKQSVLKMAVKDGMTAQDSVDAMLSKASEHNMKNVGRQQVSKELQSRGVDSPYLDIFQFCNPEDAVKLVKFNTIFAAYMPCRIALVEDSKGKMWLEMVNLDMIINSVDLPPELNQIAIETNGVMLDIITAGATGEF